MDLVVTRNTTSYQDGSDTHERLISSLFKKKKYSFIYNGIKFISDKEIVGVDPKTYKLIYKNNK